MNAFEHSLRNAQRNIPSLVAWTPFSDHKHARLILEKSTNLISAQIPHLSDLAALTPEQRKDLARKAAQARWAKAKKKLKPSAK